MRAVPRHRALQGGGAGEAHRALYHEGQEFDFILKGSLKAQFENHTEILHEGDSVIYDSSHGHGMIATGGEDCLFLAIILKVQDEKK